MKPPVLRVPSSLGTYASEGYPSWTRQVGPWEHHDTPEDRALEPRLDWGELERLAVEVEYLRVFGWLLERGERYDFSWPPEARLVSEGAVQAVYPECGEHGAEREPACEECQGLPEPELHVDAARWEWYVTVQPVDLALEPVGEPDRHMVLISDMDPLKVEYH